MAIFGKYVEKRKEYMLCEICLHPSTISGKFEKEKTRNEADFRLKKKRDVFG